MKKPWRGRIVLFKVIGLLTPVIILCLAEVLLRLFGYGYDTSLFIKYPNDHDFMVLNPDAAKKYFVTPALAPSGNSEIFRAQKDSNTTRIFVLGESTTIGFPYFHNGSFHRWLLYRLMRTYPGQNFEVINLSLTAVSSYTVADIAKELVSYQPDAILIYSGHNEYYGTLGIGSSSKLGGSPLITRVMLYLRQLRLTQLASNTYQKIANFIRRDKGHGGETMMRLMVADQRIPYQSPLFKKGLEQFRANMERTLNTLHRHNIPVFISNLVSNEKDFKPFISSEVDSMRFPGFRENYLLGLKALDNKDSTEAVQYFERADEIFPNHAQCIFYLGELAYSRNDFKKAKKYFLKASDLDELRFRAPEEIDTIIEELCRKYPNAHLVDSKKAYEDWSGSDLIGNNLILEHVHPNLLGYALLSDAFYETMKSSAFLRVDKKKEMSLSQLLRSMPVTKMDSLIGQYRVSRLKSNWPFNLNRSADPAVTAPLESEEEKLAEGIVDKQLNWSEAVEELYRYYLDKQDYQRARIVVEGLVLEHPAMEGFYEKAANLCGELNDYEGAAFYFRKAFGLSPSFNLARFLFVIYFRLDRPVDALPYLDYAIQTHSPGANLAHVKTLAQDVIGLQSLYCKDSTNSTVAREIAIRYFDMGNMEGATKYLNKVLESNNADSSALSLLAKIKREK
jgi:tetratricopeptide (TPR) repeat protein